jgi:ferredoxin
MPGEVKKLLIYYFSGTGNARNVARWIAETAETRNISVELLDIAMIDRRHIPKPPPGVMIGFVSPTHGFNYPPVSMYFLFRFPRSNGNRFFLVNTRAGLKLSKWFVPGLSGLALWLSAIVILLKGYRLSGLRSIDLPSNWISFHPGVKEKVVESIYGHCKKITVAFATRILDGKRDYKAFRDIIQDILVSPVAIAYFFMGRFMLAKTFYASRDCDRCDICIDNCPMKAILIVDKRPFWSYRCESCMRCMNNCPKRAIETAHGYITAAMFVINLVILVLFWRWVSTFIVQPADSGWYKIPLTFVRWGVTFIGLVVTYRVFHYLLRIPLVRELFYYTSFTRFRFWRRYRPSKKMISELP